jgi:hypothetical protein
MAILYQKYDSTKIIEVGQLHYVQIDQDRQCNSKVTFKFQR